MSSKKTLAANHLLPVSGCLLRSPLSFNCEPGDCVAILGGARSGKSSAIALLAGFIPPRDGNLTYQNTAISQLSPAHRRRLGFAWALQQPPSFAGLTVEEYIAIGHNGKLPKGLIRESIESFLPEIVELWHQPVTTLSRQGMRLADLASCLSQRPSVFLLDDAGLDLGAERTARLVIDLRDNGVAVILSERFAYMALKTSDWAIVLQAGRIIEENQAQSLLNNELVYSACMGEI